MMTKTQLEGMIKFHAKAEKAYRACGQTANADQAKAKREVLENEYHERFVGQK
jgi:hypothetical protein